MNLSFLSHFNFTLNQVPPFIDQCYLNFEIKMFVDIMEEEEEGGGA